MAYDEEARLIDYMFEYFPHLRTEKESIVVELFAAQSKGPRILRESYDNWGVSPDDPFVSRALREGQSEFRKQVAERILAERGDEVFVNRCPACQKIVRTPKAQQCLSCGHDWHGESTQVEENVPTQLSLWSK